jgi:hypothetical protein
MSTQVMRAVDEHQVRAAAGTTMALGAAAFAYAYFRQLYWPLQAVSAFFTLEFALRLTLGLRRSPVGLLAGLLTRRRVPVWVSVRPKRFAWSLGLVMASAMAIITNSGIRGWLPRSICLLCLALMWLESAAGLCLGCEIHHLLVRRGLAQPGPARHAPARSRAAAVASIDSASIHTAPGELSVAECAHGACAPVRTADAQP